MVPPTCVFTAVSGVALPPDGVNVTEEIVRSVVPQFHDTPTSIRRLPPVPVVCGTLMLLTSSAVLLETAPSTVTVRWPAVLRRGLTCSE